MSNRNIMYKNKKKINKMCLELFLDSDEKEIFNILEQLGINQRELLIYNFERDLRFGNLFYKFYLDAGNQRLLFRGDLKEEENVITLFKEDSVSNYSYKNKKLEFIDSKSKINDMEPKIAFDKRKSKKALRDFFFNSQEYKEELLRLISNLDIKPGFSVFVHSLYNNKFKFGHSGTFSLVCNCNDDKNTSIKLTCKGSPYLNKETIKIVSDDRSDIYDYYHHQRVKVHKRER